MLLKKYINTKYNWVRKNPVLSSWLGFLKGIIYTILAYEFFIY